MLRTVPSPWKFRRRAGRSSVRLLVEPLETRNLLSGLPLDLAALPTFAELANHATLNAAQDVGDLTAGGGALVRGARFASATEVDWYRFSLAEAADISLLASGDAGAVVSLYNSDRFNFNDYHNPSGHRLLAQQDGSLTRALAPGTYYVAVSGNGNRYFSPFLADSGAAGSTGSYDLLVTATSLGLGPQDGPRVLAADPATAANLASSPLVIRVNFSAPLDPSSISLGDNVTLIFNPTGAFGNAQDRAMELGSYNLSTAGDELQIVSAAPLGPGYYQLRIGAGIMGMPGADGSALPIGASPAQPNGRGYRLTFRVYGVEGRVSTQPDDTPETAHLLGDLTGTGVRLSGAIGDDSTDPTPFNPADVDMYHFAVSGPRKHAFSAEAFARRVGSRLDVGLTLYRRGADGQLEFMAANDNTLNNTPGSNGTLPLFSDAALFVGLTAGDYYLAVSSHDNVPDVLAGFPPGTEGLFDPNTSHSGWNGSSTGLYVLNLAVLADSEPPQVVSATPAPGATLDAPPTELVVEFSEPLNMRQLAFFAYAQGADLPVYVQGPDGERYYPRLQSWDDATRRAGFLMLDGLANGDYELHLSGALGLADFAGNPLVGNDVSGDYVVRFTVAGPERGSGGDPLAWTDRDGNSDRDHAQDLGVLFPHELQHEAGVTVTRAASAVGTASADFFRFEVLQGRHYFFDLAGAGLSAGNMLSLFDANGNAVAGAFNGQTLKAVLEPGTYVIAVGSWTPEQSESVSYKLRITLGGGQENPTPLTIGPAPVLRIRLSDLVPGPAPAAPAAPATPPPVSIAPGGNPSRPDTSAPSSFQQIPVGVLLSLGAGPIGGVRGQVAPAPSLALFSGSALQLGMGKPSSIAGLALNGILPIASADETSTVTPAVLPELESLSPEDIELIFNDPEVSSSIGIAPLQNSLVQHALVQNSPERQVGSRPATCDENGANVGGATPLSAGVGDPWAGVLLALSTYAALPRDNTSAARKSRVLPRLLGRRKEP